MHLVDVPTLFNRLAAAPDRAAPVAPDPRRVPDHVDVAVIGAGIIGLSVAWRLAARGVSVAVFDAFAAGGGTSSAATGMLAAAAELEPGGESLLALGLESQSLWPGFRDLLEQHGGGGIDYRADGTLVLAVGRDEVDRLRARHALQCRAGLETRWLGSAAARDAEPGLRPSVSGGIFCPTDHQVDPRLVLEALRRALRDAGGRLVETAAIEALDRECGRVTGVVVAGRTCRAGTTVLATGAAIGSAAFLPAEIRLPVRPLKGQSMALRTRRGPLPIEHVVWTSEIHLAPKSDGRLILGATIEEAGFDPSVTAGGAFALLDAARRVLPGIEEMAIDSLWNGFRPTSDDDAPILGETSLAGLVVAAGHHRNGYLLAPVTAKAIEDLVVTGQIRGEAARFGPARFGPARLGPARFEPTRPAECGAA